MAAAVPFALKAGTAIGGSLIGKLMNRPSAQQQQAGQMTAQAGQASLGAGRGLLNQGQSLTRAGASTMAPAASYYTNILSNRRAGRESLAPEMSTALDFYKGAASKTARSTSGGTRDYAMAELDRQKVGQMAGMLPAARRAAAEGAGQIGSSLISGGAAASGQGTNALTSGGYLGNLGFQQALQQRQMEQQGGRAWGGMLYDLMSQMPWGKPKPLGGNTTPGGYAAPYPMLNF